MSKRFLTPTNLLHLESDPGSGTEGDIYFNTLSNVIKVYYSSAWHEIGGGSGITVSTTAPENPEIGDAWYKNDTGEFYVYDGTFWVEVNGVVSLTQEQVQDYVAPLFTHLNHINITASYNDEANQIVLTGSSAVSGDLTNVDSITYPDYITFDTTPETVPTESGSIYWDSGDGLPATILNSNVTIGLGQEQVALVKNATGASIPKGKVVYINGAQGQRPTITLSDADTESTSSKTFGLTAETIADEAEGFVTTFGVLRGVNTLGLTEGSALWLSSTAGGYITTVPAEPAHSVFIGYVVKAHETAGEIFVNIQNGYELTELHGVIIEADEGLADNEVLAYDDASGLWKNQTSVEAGLIDTSATEQTKAGNLIIGGDLTVATDILSTGLNLVISNDEVVALNTANNNAGISEDTGFSITTNGVGVPNIWVFNNNGNFTFPDATSQTTAFLGMASYDTDDLAEGSNLYFTDARARTALSADLGGTNGGIRIIAPSNTADATLSNDSATHQVIVGPSGNGTNIKGTMSILASPSIADPGNLGVAGYIDAAGSVTGSSIIKDGGTSAEFLKADGSVDTNTYLTTTDASSTYATITSLGDYLTTLDASSLYLTQSTAASTYQPIGSYLTSYTETDPVFIASEAYNITSTDTTNWDSAFGWGNHASAGYLTSYTETDTLSDVTSRGATTSSAIEITNATASSSHTTGALIVSGGVGIGEDLYVNNNVYVGGNINITGSITGDLTSVDVTNLVVTDPLIYLAEGNPDDSVDIGIFAALNHGSPSYSHTGLIRDASDSGKWKLASGLSDPTSNVIDFTGATYDTLKLGTLEATSVPTVGTITSGTWNGTTIGYAYGGTGLTTLGTAGQVLAVNSTEDAIEWVNQTGGGGSSAAAVTSDPPASPTLNQVWQDLDTGRIYVWNGDFWIEVQQNGSLGLLRYLGASATAPTMSIDGSSLQVGEVYFDTTFNVMKVYDGTGWEDAFTAGSLSVNKWTKVMSGGETSLSGNDDSSVSLTYVAGIESVFLNGVKLVRGSDYIATNGTTITNLEPILAGSVVEVISYSGFTVANTYTKAEVDALVAKQGTRWTETAASAITTLSGLDDFSTTLSYIPGTELVYINGILMVRSVDYTATNGTSITLAAALAIGDVVEVFSTNSFSVANTYTKAEVDSKLLGYQICTSSTRPASPTEGQMIYETDTNIVRIWDSAKWVAFHRPGEIIESLAGLCDGSNSTVTSGTYTFQNVTTQQNSGNTYTDITGSVMSYTPPPGATKVIYKFNFSSYWETGAHAISHYKFFIDGVEVVYARHNRSAQYQESKNEFVWVIGIGGTANTNTGRQATWTTPKELKMQVRAYSSTANDNNLHGTVYWDGAGSNQFSMPSLTIEAIA